MSIYPDKGRDGKLTGRFRVEVQSNGQRARGRFDTLKEAQEKEREWTKAFSLGYAPGVSKKRMDNHGKPTTLSLLVREAHGSLWHGITSEKVNYQKLDIIIDLLDDVRLDEITTATIDTLEKKLRTKRKVGPKTLNRYYSVFLTLLKWAKARKYIKELPDFPWKKEKEGRIRVITPEEENRLVQLLKSYGRSDIADLVTVAIRTGLRRGELLGLKERDLERGWIRLHGDQTKNGCNRSVPVDPVTECLLRSLICFMPNIEVLRYYWERARDDMGLAEDPYFVFHACRHTCASRLVYANVNLRVIQEWMGHKAIQTTLRYSHVRNENLENALDKLMAHGIQNPMLTTNAAPLQGDGAQLMGSVAAE